VGILTAGSAAAARRAFERALPDRLAISRIARTADGAGGWTEGTTVYASGIPCRVDRSGLSPREREVAERLGAVTTVNVVLSMVASRWPGGVPLTLATDTFTVTGDAAGSYQPAEGGDPVTDELVKTIICTRA